MQEWRLAGGSAIFEIDVSPTGTRFEAEARFRTGSSLSNADGRKVAVMRIRKTDAALLFVLGCAVAGCGQSGEEESRASVGVRQEAATYATSFVVVKSPRQRERRRFRLIVQDNDCAADETLDSAERFAGVSVRRERFAYVLVARFRSAAAAEGTASTCEGTDDPRLTVRTTVTLPTKLGRRAVVNGAPGPSDFRFVLIPPVGPTAIRALVPRFIYSGRMCDRGPVKNAFKGRPKDEWCFY